MIEEQVKEQVQRLTMFAFELSNRCNYAAQHVKCPVNPSVAPIILPTALVLKVMRSLASYGFSGKMYFNIYNEPLIDPRLSLFLTAVREYFQDVTVDIFTNGWYLNQPLLDDLYQMGAKSFTISAYSQNEYDRLKQLTPQNDVRWELVLRTLDDRMDVYKNTPHAVNSPCGVPSSYGFVNCRGKFAMCCYDYNYVEDFGDLHTQTLEEVLLNPRRLAVCSALEQGNRAVTDVCSRCMYNLVNLGG